MTTTVFSGILAHHSKTFGLATLWMQEAYRQKKSVGQARMGQNIKQGLRRGSIQHRGTFPTETAGSAKGEAGLGRQYMIHRNECISGS